MTVGRVLRLVSLVAGVGAMGFGFAYALHRSLDVRPAVWGRWIVTGAVVHDLVVAPAVIGIGWLVVLFVPRPAKAPVQAALLVSAVLALVAFPSLRGYGRRSDNGTILPRDYPAGLFTALAVTWTVALVWTLVRLSSRRTGPDPR